MRKLICQNIITRLKGVNKESDLSQGVHKNIITRLKGVSKESDLS